jgi:trans-aconitate 2-methyltransferase
MERSINTGPREWDADTYDAVSDPQFEWGTEVLGRLELRGDESAIDAGCGSGKVTEKLLDRLPAGKLLAVDGSEAMIAKAKERLGDRADYLVADLAELKVEQQVDLIFSTATFHWIADHDRLFRHLCAGLSPVGRLVAQCGGQGNVARHAEAIAKVVARAEFAAHFEQASGIWNFAGRGRPKSACAARALPRLAAGWSRSPSRPPTRLPSPLPSRSDRSWPSSPKTSAGPSPKRSSRRRLNR